MPSVILRPISAGGFAQLTSSNPPNPNYLMCGDASDSTYVHGNANGLRDRYQLGPVPASANSITQVDINIRCMQEGGPAGGWGWQPNWYTGGVDVFGATTEPAGSPTTYLYSAVARPGGGSWQVSDFNSGLGVQLGQKLVLVDIPILPARMQDVWAVVTYAEASGKVRARTHGYAIRRPARVSAGDV